MNMLLEHVWVTTPAARAIQKATREKAKEKDEARVSARIRARRRARHDYGRGPYGKAVVVQCGAVP